MAANRFAKYIVQPEQDQGGGAAPAPAKKPNRFAKYVEPQQPVAPAQPSAAPGMAMVAMGQSAGPRQPAPNPNAPNPIIAAQRASQTQAMGDFAAQKEAEARALAQRREGAGLGALTDMPMVYDDAGNMRPGTAADQDLSKGIVGSPINFGQGLAEGGANGMNALFAASTGIGNAVLNVFDPNREQSQPIRIDVPRNVIVDQGGPLESMSGVIPRVAGQISGPRVAIGKVAPGGNFGSSMAKDAIATGLGTPQDAPRISDMFPEGTPIADQLRTREGDNAFTAFGKNAAEDLLASTAIGGVMRGGTAILDAIGRPSGRAVSPAPMAPPVQPQPAAQPSVAPIPQPTVSNAPRRAAQPAAPGAGQGAPATLQAAPTAAPGATPALANSDRKIIGRLLRAGGVPRNDVDRVLSGLVVAHQSSNSARLPLAFFAEEYLPTVLPKQTADDVIQKLRGFGRERYGANDPRDPSRSIVRNTINELRGSQRETLTNQFEGLLGKETLMTKQGKIARDKQGVAEAVYAEEIGRQQRLLAEGAAAPEQVAARDDLLGFMSRKDYFDQIPPEIKLKAADEGKDLWEYVHTNPIEAAHWLQSQLGVLARKGNTIAEAMRMPVVRRLEDSVPGYRGARMEYGDLSGQQAALEFGDDLYRVGGSKFATDQKALEFKKLSRAQKTVAKKSIRDKLLNEFRKAKTGDDQAAVITAMQKDGVLDALETILGPEGKKVADSIRGMVRENERLRAIDLQSGSNTADNLAQMRAAQEAVRSPVNRAVGSIGDESSYARTVFADAVSVALGLPPVWTAGKVGAGVVGKFGAPSKRKLASATRTLYDLPRTAGAAAPEAAPRRAPSRSTPRRQIEAPTQENLDALLKQYDQTPTPALRNKIIAMRKKMNLPARTGDEGFAGVTPMATLAGGAGGYLGAQDLNGDGTVDAGERAAFTALGLGGGYLGGRALSGKGGPKRARNAPASGAGPRNAPVQTVTRPVQTTKMQVSELRTKNGSVPVEAEVFPDRGAVVMSPKWPSYDAMQLEDAISRQRGRLPTSLDRWESFAKQNPQEAAMLESDIAAEFNKLAKSGQAPAYNLALFEDYNGKNIVDMVRTAKGDNQVVLRTKDGGDVAVVDRKWLAENTDRYPRMTWEPVDDRWPLRQGENYHIIPRGDRFVVIDDASKEVSGGLEFTSRRDALGWLRSETSAFSDGPSPARSQSARAANGVAPPPASAPKQPKRESPGAVSRIVTGGVVGGSVASIADAQEEDLAPKIAQTEQDIASIKKAMADFDKITDPRAKQQFLKDAGFYAGKIDGNIAGKTTEGMERWKAQQAAALKKAEDDYTELVRRDAYQKNQPDAIMQGLREFGPTTALVGALFGMKLMRGGAARKAAMAAEAESRQLNRLITKAPVTGFINKADQSRPANLNALWQKGGANADELPFKQDSSGRWKPNPKAKAADELFKYDSLWQSVSKYIKGKDIALILGGSADAVGMQPFIDKANEELKQAEAEWKANPSDETFKRVEDAKNAVMVYTTLQRFGMGLAGGRVLGSIGAKYAKPKPNIPAAATEQAALKQYIASLQPPKKPRAKKVPPTLPPTPGSGGSGSQP